MTKNWIQYLSVSTTYHQLFFLSFNRLNQILKLLARVFSFMVLRLKISALLVRFPMIMARLINQNMSVNTLQKLRKDCILNCREI